MRSNAPTPSTDTTVASPSKSVSACKMWATVWHPALVLRAGSELLGNGLSNESPENVPTTIPLTPPSGFWRGVILPRVAQCCRVSMRLTEGERGRQSFQKDQALLLGMHCARSPRRDLVPKLNSSAGANWAMSSGTLFLGRAGRRSGSFNASKVFVSPGAKQAPSRACLPANNSPNWTMCKARLARFSTPLICIISFLSS